MLVVTAHAAQLVQELISQAGLPEGSGMRIVVNPAHGSLCMSLVSGPRRKDTVLTADATRIFLTRWAVDRLHGSTLGAQVSPARSAFFLDG